MAGSIGVVRQVVGEVYAVAANGARRLLTDGDRVFAGEQLVTGARGAVAVTLSNGQELVLGRESSMPLHNGLLANAPDGARPDAASAAAAPSQQDLTDVEQLQAAIEAGVDPTQAAEATAAGPGVGAGAGNAGGGHSFVLLDEVGGALDPTIGFPTGGIGATPEFPTPFIDLAPEVVPAVVDEPVNGVPVAEDDVQGIREGQESVQGNVLDNDDGGPDLPTTFLSWQAPGASNGPGGSLVVNTPYGVVSLNPDGSYSFVLANGTPAVEGLAEGQTVDVSFGYSIQDSNGDQSSATLTITITGSNDVPTIDVSSPNAEGGLAQVFEKGLVGGSAAGDGSNVTTGSFTVGDADGLADLKSLSVGSLSLDLSVSGFASLVGQSFATAHGTVLITGYSNGTYSFSYTLTSATTDAAGPETDGFLISVGDGLATASATVSIEIVDDLPSANPDSGSLIENGALSSLVGNVLDNDVGGADQPKAFSSWNGVAGATPGEGGSLLVNTPYGLVTLNPNGSYSFVLANGSAAVEALAAGQQVSLQYAYTMRDGDGDPSSSTLTITITGSNDVPTIDVSSPNAEGGLAQVFEKGLAGGSAAGDGSNVTTGSFTVGDADGLADLKSLSVGSLSLDLSVSGFASLVGQSFATAHGTVLITGYSNGTYSFSYTLTSATTDAAGPETDGFLISVGDGLATASATVSIEIVDDLPSANPDSGSLIENGALSSLAGNVLDNDVGGADQPKAFSSWNGVAGATPGEGGSLLVNTPYGLVTLNPNGSYSFVLANGSAAVEALAAGQQVSLQYAYTMRDGDGDPSSSTLTITITGSNDVPTIDVSSPNAEGGLAQVFEKGLVGGSAAGDGSNVTTGSFTVGDADGLADLKSLSVGSLSLDLSVSGFASLVGQSFATAHGTVLITGYSNGTYSFSYTLTSATTDAAGPETDGFLISVGDGLATASATVSIEIVDDLPSANPDSGSLIENGALSSLVGNVLDNDVGGADQPKAFSSWNGVAGATPGEGGSLLVNTPYGLVTLNPNGSYSFVLANGSAAVEALAAGQQVSLQYAYTMRDGDGDPSSSTLTITITGSNDVPTIDVSSPNAEGGLAQVFEKGLAGGSAAGDGSNVTTGSFTVGDADGLADLKSLSVGSLSLDLSVSGFASLVGQSFATAHGTVLITGYSNGTYSFSYTLTSATTDAAGPETDGFLISVGDGLATASATVSIEIVDDLPQARADAAVVGEGSSVSGNVVTGVGAGSVADLFGADGRPSPTTGVVGVRVGADISTPVAGGVGDSISTAFGTLVLNADGSYTYTSRPDTVGAAGAVDTFTYTIVDADGDLSTTTLTIDLSDHTVVGSVQAGSDQDVREAALSFGSEPSSDDEFASGTLVGSGGNGPYSFSLDAGAGNGQYGQLVVNSSGAYTYTLVSAPKVNPGNNGNNLQFTETFTFRVTDANGNTGIGVLTIGIVDDVPSVSVKGLGGLELQVDETTLGETASTHFAGAFTTVFGADGAAASNAIEYSLNVKAQGVDSGLRDTATGNSILLSKVGSDIVGLVSGGGQLAFRLSVASDGSVTLEQMRAIFHTPNTGPDQAAGLAAADLITLTARVTDADGDKDSATLNLGDAISFKDDAPRIDPYVKVYLDDDALPHGNPGGVGDRSPDTHNTSGVIAHDFGADGPGEIELQDSGAPYGFTYVETKDGLLIKQGDVTVITITLDKFTGAYTVTQNAPILHPEGHDENDLTFEVEYKITDRDGDRADGSLYIKVNDDTPVAYADSASVSEGGSVSGNVVTGVGAGSVADLFGADGRPSPTTGVVGVRVGADISTPVAGGVGDSISTAFGTLVLNADGSYTYTSRPDTVGAAGAVDTFTYTIVDADGDLSTTTLTIDLANVTVAGAVQAGSDQDVREAALSFGSEPSSDDEFASGTLVGSGGNGPYSFSLDAGAGNGQYGQLVVNSSGAYTYTLVSAPKVNPGDNGNNLQFTETFTFRVTDANGNTGIGVLTIGIVDDVPKVSVKGLGGLDLQVDETTLGETASTHFAGAFTTVFGADGAAASNAIEYSLNVKAQGVDSGLRDTATGNSILLSKVGSDIVGLVSGGGQLAFRLSVAGDGSVTLEQMRAIFHTPNTGPDQAAGLAAADLITLTARVTDADGDKDSATLNLGDAISFRDAAPTVTSNGLVLLDDDALPGGIPGGTGDGPDAVNTLGSVGFSYGADGAGSVQWLTTGAPDGFTYVKSGSTLLIKQGTTTVIEVTLNSTSGAYGVTQLAPIQHALGGHENDQLFTLTYQVTDKDGDSTNGSLDIKVNDDTPYARDDIADVAEGSGQDFNVVFVLDFSGSIDNTELNTMLTAVRSAGQTLFNTTDGDVRIQLVAFSGTAASYPVVTDVGSFISLVNSLNPQAGGTRPFSGNTDFTAAIEKAMAVYTPIPSWSNQVFFISDGNPNEQTGPNGSSLTSAVATQWNHFVNGNGINVTAIGVGNGINTARLQDVDVDGSGSPILVNNFGDLVETLAGQIVGGIVSGNVLLGSDNAVGGGDDDAFGADGPGRILSIQIGTTTYTWNGAGSIAVSTGGTLSGNMLNALTTPLGGKLTFDFSTGAWTYVAPNSVAADTSEHFIYTIVDKDGDPSSASLTVRIEDASPVIGRVDEDELPGGITDGDGQTTVATGNLSELLVGTPAGAQFSVAATPLAMPLATSHGVALTYSSVGNTLIAKAGTTTIFTLQVQSNGDYTFTLLGALDHPGSGAGGDDQLLTLNLTGALRASNGSGSLPLAGDLLIQVEDDVPAILQSSNLMFSNGDSVAGASGVFVYSTGADTRGAGPFSPADSDFTSIGLSGTVGGVAISSGAVTWMAESAASATFRIGFDYAPNPASPGTLEQASGTLTFDKVNGTYSVALDEPIQGYTILKTSTSLSITGYEVNSTVPDSTQPAVAVVALNNNFFVQYTSYAEPSSGTGSDNLRAGSSSTSVFTDGELFNQAMSWVSVSNSANGVAGDTLGKGEVLDLNFYSSNPKGHLGVEPNARADGMFLKFDGVNNEDLVVVLKLIGVGGVKTTRALVVSNADIMTANSAVLAAYGIYLDNNDGAIVIEKNDFNAPGENWQIYGAQVLTSVEGITSSAAINFNSAIGNGGASNVNSRVSFTSSDTDHDVLKVSDVGFITSETNTLDTTLDFSVAIRDADGDTSSTRVLQVNLEASSTFVGTASDDVIQGTSGNDLISGMGGNDVLIGGAGNDVLDGGNGIDTASYQGATAGVTVDLSLLVAQDTVGAGIDTLLNIENLLGSGLNDTLSGNSGDNVLAGNGGNDRLTGGDGADTFKWLLGDTGVTTITDFTPGVDKLDLSQLLTGEHSNVGSLDDYLTMAFGANTTITVDSNTPANPGGTGQTIVLEGVNLLTAYGAPDTASVISHMLDDGTLKVDA
ncbi:retention module-containing protein [Pseudomonas sp. Q1-7]|uniref:retention module-containing protein n=1 Tax=Pseudomonas sp. Q1-7 TaxID=3020843 RepID=UPI00230132A3|nr:retention module-containing protein [Pseudomonas sp. Q1-7]